MNKDGNMIFQEVQRFGQWWLWLIILSVSAIQLIVAGIAFGLAFGVALIWLFYAMKLVTEVRSDGLYIRFFPFHFSFQRIPLENLKSFEV